MRTRERVGVDLSSHDLRHAGHSLAATAGASVADLKKRLGHSSSAAAQRSLHTVEGRAPRSLPPPRTWLAPATPRSLLGACDVGTSRESR